MSPSAAPIDTQEPVDLPESAYPWIFENLMSGRTASALIQTVLASRSPYKEALVQEILRAQRNPYIQAATRLRDTLNRREWLMKTFDQLALQEPEYGTAVVRREVPDFSHFMREHYSRNRPAILTGGVDHWPALREWSPASLEARCGHHVVEVQSGRAHDPHYARRSRKYKTQMLFRDFSEQVTQGGASNDLYFTSNNNRANRHMLRELRDDGGDFGRGYRRSQTMSRGCHLWYGPKGVFRPLHLDLTNNMLVQIYGRKRVTLVPANQAPYIYNDSHVYSEMPYPVQGSSRFPMARHLTPVDVILDPGEALFIPVGWWHCVEGLDVSMSVVFTDFNARNDFHQRFPQ